VAISFGGINTGLPPNLVDQLVELEKLPIKKLEQKKGKTQTKLDLVNELDTKLRDVLTSLGELTNTKGFSDVQVVSGDPNIISGTADPEAVSNGSWNIEVMELANKPSAITNGFPDKDKTQVGIGYIKFNTPDGPREIFIDGSNNTLERVASKINTSGTGLQATVIKDNKDEDEPFKLMVSGIKTGNSNDIEYPTLYFLDGDQDFYFDEKREAKNGKIKIDGFEIDIDNNKLNDIIPGVTLDLKQAAPGRSINVSVAENKEVVSAKIKEFVDKMNAVLGFIQTQSKVNERTDTTKTLGGDSLIRTVENDLRRMIQGVQFGVQGEVKQLNQLGIVFNRNGTLDFDQEKFNKVLAQKPGDVKAFFVGDGSSVGLVPQVRNTINRITNSAFGPIGIRKKALTQQLQQADQRIEAISRQVEQKERNLRRKFSNLEETMSRLKSQGAQLAARLGGPAADSMNFGGASFNKSQ
jgi:flagellar hook-associated protein 2